MTLPSLVQPDDLAAALDDPSVVVLDASANLTPAAEGDPYTMTSGRTG